MAAAPNLVLLTVAWTFCQLAANAAFAALLASFADNVPVLQRGRGSGIIGFGQNLAILSGTYAAVLLVRDLPLLFLLPGVLGVTCVVIYSLRLPDVLPAQRVEPLHLADIVQTCWTNPFVHRDFGWAWWSRFMITLASYLFTTFRLYFVQDRLGQPSGTAVSTVATGVLIYAIALLLGTVTSGWLTDRLRRRKVFVFDSTMPFGVGLVVLVLADQVWIFYIGEATMGLAWGVYIAVDTALVVDVLPDPVRPGKDLGVLNIANALPQSFAPGIGAVLLAVGGSGDYDLLLWAAGIAAALDDVAIIPVRKVR